MIDKVTPLFAGTAVPGQQNDAVVALLENLLSRAKSGEVVSVAVAGYTADDCMLSSFETGAHTSSTLGAIRLLESRIIDSLRGFD